MTGPVHIVDGRGATKNRACVTSVGQVITAPFDYDLAEFRSLSVIDTAFNFYQPQIGKQFVITGMRIKAGRFVSNTIDATIVIYEGTSDITLTEDRVLFEEALIRSEDVTLLPTNILASEGKFINAKTDDATIFINIMGYFIPILT